MNRKFYLNFHLYLGLLLSITILMLSITGFYLNHQHDWFHKQHVLYLNPEYRSTTPGEQTEHDLQKLTMPEAIVKGAESNLYTVDNVKRVNHANHGLGTFFYIHLYDDKGTIVVVDEQGVVVKAYVDNAIKKWMYDLHVGIVDKVNFIFINDLTALGTILLTISGIILSVRLLKVKKKRSNTSEANNSLV